MNAFISLCAPRRRLFQRGLTSTCQVPSHPLIRHFSGILRGSALCLPFAMMFPLCGWCGGHPISPPPAFIWGAVYFQRSERQGTRLYVRSCLRPLHTLHMLCRFSMLWLGSPLPGAMMWSIVQSLPSSSLPQIVQIGSSTFFAASRAVRHAWLWCQSATVCLV